MLCITIYKVMEEKLLYKYRSAEEDCFERDLKALKENYFWASDVEHLNDDQECFYNAQIILKQLKGLKFSFPGCSESIGSVEKQLRGLMEKVKTIGVFSLSRNPHIPSMWALYASERKGYCIIYRENKLMEYTNGVCLADKNLLDVVYAQSAPALDFRDFTNQNLLTKLVATKEQSWSYEEETRIVTDTPQEHKYVSSALYGIIFGAKMSENYKQKIKDTLVGRNIKFFQLRHKENDYGYEHILIDEFQTATSLSDEKYDFINKSTPVVDNFFIKLNFTPSSNKEIKDFVREFIKKHTDRQCNIYIYDKNVDMGKFDDDYHNYDYLQKYLIAEKYLGSDDLFFNKAHKS